MMNSIAEIAIAVSDSLPLSIVVKATVITALALIFVRLTRRSRASVRHLLLAAVFIVLLLLPLGAVLAPSLSIAVARVEPEELANLTVQTIDAATANTVNTAVGRLQVDTGLTSIPLSTMLASLWAAGMIMFLLPVIAGLCQLRRIRSGSVPWLHGQAVVRELADGVGVKRSIRVMLSDHILGPMTTGIVHPAIVCPTDVTSWSGPELEHAMLHELEHVRRADCVIHGISRLACAVYWFHPFVWMSWRRLRLEAERACDDAVLGRADATEYADQLVTLARRIQAGARTHLLAMANRNDLKVRIASVLDAKQCRGRPGASWTAAVITASALLFAIAPLRAVSTIAQASQTQPQAPLRPSFAVASVKSNVSDEQRSAIAGQPGGRYVATNVTLATLIASAYRVRDFQVTGGPSWLTNERWDVDARPQDGTTLSPALPDDPNSFSTVQLMLQSLLEDRFQLRMHRQAKETAVYELLPANGAVKLKLSLDQSDVPRNASALRRGNYAGRAIVIASLSAALAQIVGRPVIDRTNLSGRYDVTLDWVPDTPQDSTTAASAQQLAGTPLDGVSIFTALQEQLGLRLQSGKAPVDALIIDSVNKPTPN